MTRSIPKASLPKRERIRKRSEYLLVQEGGRKLSTPSFLVFVRALPATVASAPPVTVTTAPLATEGAPASTEGAPHSAPMLAVGVRWTEGAPASTEGAPAITERQPAEAPARFGITVTKKIGGAVVRNRIKRLVREAVRRHKLWFPPGREVVFVAKRPAAELGLAELERELETLCTRYFARP